MACVLYFIISLAHLALVATQEYTSLDDMPAWKTLPPGPKTAASKGLSYDVYAGCATSVPQISDAACFATLPEMSSSLLSNMVSDGYWDTDIPTQFQASATSVVRDWCSQPAVGAAIGVNLPAPTSSTIDSSTSTANPAKKDTGELSTVAEVFTILGSIFGASGIVTTIILYRKGKLRFHRKRAGAQDDLSWPLDNSDEQQEGATNIAEEVYGLKNPPPATTHGSRNHTAERNWDRANAKRGGLFRQEDIIVH